MKGKTFKLTTLLLLVSLILNTFAFQQVNASAAFITNITIPTLPQGWVNGNEGLTTSGSLASTFANESVANFTFEGDVKFNGSGSNTSQAGLLFRSQLKTNYQNTYAVMIDKVPSGTVLTLQKFINSGNGQVLGSANISVDWGTFYHVKVVAQGKDIKVYFNNSDSAIIVTRDADFKSGYFGLLSAGTSVTFNNVNYNTNASFLTNLSFPVNNDYVNDYTGLVGFNPNYATGVFSAETGSNFNYEGDIEFTQAATNRQAGLIFRSQNSNSQRSYAVMLDNNSGVGVVSLQKYQNSYDGTILGSYSTNLNLNARYHVKIAANGSNIKVYLNNSSTPCIDVNDATYSSGNFGLIVAGAKATFNNVYKSDYQAESSTSNVNIIVSQMGYTTTTSKKAYIIDATDNKIAAGTTFDVVNSDNNTTVYTGNVVKYGSKWNYTWWTLDFSNVKTPGNYYLKVNGVKTNIFKIDAKVLTNFNMETILLEQLDRRFNNGDAKVYNDDNPSQGVKYYGMWLTADGTYSEGIYRDCSSNTAEIESIGLTVKGLIDVYKYQKNEFSTADQNKILNYIKIGADYIVASQRSSGKFAHSLLTNKDGSAWFGNTHTYNDLVFAISVLTDSYNFMKDIDATKAARYLNSAKKAYAAANRTTYDTDETQNAPTKVNSFDPRSDYDKYYWSPNVTYFNNSPEIGVGWGSSSITMSRNYYNKNNTWSEPTTIKTREKLTLLYGTMNLYEITQESSYLTAAVNLANSISDRQFIDWEHSIEGVYGTFYEFEGDNNAFSIEYGNGGGQHLGVINAITIKGIVKLLQAAPTDSNAAKWDNMIKTYIDGYVKKSATLSPLGIQPISVTSNTNGASASVNFFKTLLHGGTGHYGETAMNLLDLASIYNDQELYNLATNNMQYYTGLNPGFVAGENVIAPKTMFTQIGVNSQNLSAESIPGGVINGFKAGPQWETVQPSQIQDKADTTGWQEDWLPNSHDYAATVARLESDFALNLKTSNNDALVASDVSITANGSTYNYTINSTGQKTITDLPHNTPATITVTYNGSTMTKTFNTIAGGSLDLSFDFAKNVDFSIVVPSKINKGATGTAVFTITNNNSNPVSGTVKLSMDGVTANTDNATFWINSHASATMNIAITAGNKVKPYDVYAYLEIGNTKIFKSKQGFVATPQ